jgi:hypothetical protein
MRGAGICLQHRVLSGQRGQWRGAQTAVYRASSLAVGNITGKYWEKYKAIPFARDAYEESIQTRLWEISDKMVAARATLLKVVVAKRARPSSYTVLFHGAG